MPPKKSSSKHRAPPKEQSEPADDRLEIAGEKPASPTEDPGTEKSRLEEKLRALETINDDLNALINSAEIATLSLDNDFRIRHFTPSLRTLMQISSSDVGRPVMDLPTRVHDPELLKDAREVQRYFSPVSRQVDGEQDHVFLRNILPRRTKDGKTNGVVITFTDVTTLRETGEKLKARERQQAAIAQLGKEALAGKSRQHLFQLAARLLAHTLQCDLAKVLEYLPDDDVFLMQAGVGWEDGLVGKARVEGGFESQAGFTFNYSGPVIVENLAQEKRFRGPPLLHDHGVLSGMSVPIILHNEPWGVLGVHARRERSFDVDDIHFIQSFANILAAAIVREKDEQRLLESENQMRLLTDGLPAMIAYVGKDERYRFVNAGFERIYQRSKESILGLTVQELAGPKLYSQVAPYIHAALDGQSQSFEATVDHDGQRIWQISYVPDTPQHSEAHGFYAIVMDVTEQRQTEERVRTLLKHTASGFIGMDEEFRCIYLNEAAPHLLDCDREQLYRQRLWDVCAALNTPEFKTTLETCMREKKGTSLAACAAPGKKYLDVRCSPVGDGIVITLANVTVRVESEMALRKSEERFRLAERAFNGLVYEWQPENNFGWRSNGMETVIGIHPDDSEQTADWWFERIHEGDIQPVRQTLEAALHENGGSNYEVSYRVRHADGSWVSVWDRGLVVRDDADRGTTVYGNVVNVTDHVAAQMRLQELNEKLEERVRERTAEMSASAEALEKRSYELATLAENVPAIFAYLSKDCVFRFANKKFEELYHRTQTEILGLSLNEVIGPDGAELLADTIEKTLQGETMSYERQLDIPRHGCRWLSAVHVPRKSKNGDVEGFFFLAQDITKRKRLEAELVTIAEEERAAFSCELQDSLGSFLTGLSFRIQALENDVKNGIMPKEEDVSYVAGLLGKSVDQARELARGWQPVEDKPEGLMRALEQLTETVGKSNGSECFFACPQPVLVDDLLVANNLYRIAQEAITNAVKYSGSSRIEVRLSKRDTALNLIIEDNGPRVPESESLGHRTMRHRASVIGADLTTAQGSAGGTKVECHLKTKRSASRH